MASETIPVGYALTTVFHKLHMMRSRTMTVCGHWMSPDVGFRWLHRPAERELCARCAAIYASTGLQLPEPVARVYG